MIGYVPYASGKNTSMPTTFSQAILNWFDIHGRKHLPWQQHITAYRVWVSEIMLQQTQVTTVIPYFERFMLAFPSVTDLAQAPIDKVLHLWTGLGYYARARNLHRAANIIVEQHDAELPLDVEALVALPGIGRSTACAILSITHGQALAILDGNVKRVLARFYAVEGWPGKPDVERRLWQLAEALVPEARCADYTQAMMDLGATLCTRSRPQCQICPIASDCQALQQGEPTTFPHKKPTRVLPQKQCFLLMLCWDNQVWLEPRAATGLWGGLYGFPEMASEQALAMYTQGLGYSLEALERLPPFRHTFSHFHLDLQPCLLTLTHPPATAVQEGGGQWFVLEKWPEVGLAAPTKRLFSALRTRFGFNEAD